MSLDASYFYIQMIFRVAYGREKNQYSMCIHSVKQLQQTRSLFMQLTAMLLSTSVKCESEAAATIAQIGLLNWALEKKWTRVLRWAHTLSNEYLVICSSFCVHVDLLHIGTSRCKANPTTHILQAESEECFALYFVQCSRNRKCFEQICR